MTRRRLSGGPGVLLLLRHGETDWNRERRIMGRLPVDLNDVGRRQIAALIPLVRPLHVTSIVTSPMRRAHSTAMALAEPLGGTAIREDEGLAEVGFGEWEGRHYADLARSPEFREHLRDPMRNPLPGGGESLSQVRERMIDAVGRACAENPGSGAVLLVSHGDPIRLLLAESLDLPAESFRRLRIDNGGLSGLELSGDRVEVKFVNAHPELPGVARREADQDK